MHFDLTSWNNGSYQNYYVNGPNGYYGNGNINRIGNYEYETYDDSYGSITRTTNYIGSYAYTDIDFY